MKVQLSDAQASVVVTSKTKTRYDMHKVRVRPDGTTESTDGRIWLRVFPKESSPCEEMLIAAKALTKARRERANARSRPPSPASPIMVDTEAGTLEYVTSAGLRVCIPGAVEAGSANYPPTQDIERSNALERQDAHAFLDIKLLQKVLTSLKNGGGQMVRIDVPRQHDRARAVRFKCLTPTEGIVGVLMPVFVPSGSPLQPSSDARPPKEKE